jgi:hypothetical protein
MVGSTLPRSWPHRVSARWQRQANSGNAGWHRAAAALRGVSRFGGLRQCTSLKCCSPRSAMTALERATPLS